MNKMNKKGFTLIEMLVVIAIIAVLVSIIIPVVSNSTDKAKYATNAANLRSVQAEVVTKTLTGVTVSATDFADVKFYAIGGSNSEGLKIDGTDVTYNGWTAVQYGEAAGGDDAKGASTATYTCAGYGETSCTNKVTTQGGLCATCAAAKAEAEKNNP